MNQERNPRKAAIIGAGFVGGAIAFHLMQHRLFSEMVLLDAVRERAEGEAMDISHGVPFAAPMRIWAGTYDDVADASIVIITAGANQKPDESRLALAKKNQEIFASILPELTRRGFAGILLVVSNPVDILTYYTIRHAGLPEGRVLGSGTVLDTARLRYELGRMLGVDSRSTHAFIIGEHGDSELAVFSSANVAGIPLRDFCRFRGHTGDDTERLAAQVRNSAYEIISKKHATYFGIAMAVGRICEALVRDEKSILPVSTMLHGEYGLSDIALSTPCVVGKYGVEARIPLSLNEAELSHLHTAAEALRAYQGA